MKCRDCQFFEDTGAVPNNAEMKKGICHRYPEVYIGDTDIPDGYANDEVFESPFSWRQPVVFATGWCGEFKEKSE